MSCFKHNLEQELAKDDDLIKASAFLAFVMLKIGGILWYFAAYQIAMFAAPYLSSYKYPDEPYWAVALLLFGAFCLIPGTILLNIRWVKII